MKKIILLFVTAAAITVSCKKNKVTDNSSCATALVKYGGDPAADGVGWYLLVDESAGVKAEYPENLADQFKVEGLAVNVCYSKSNKDFSCYCAPPLPKMITITSIKKR